MNILEKLKGFASSQPHKACLIVDDTVYTYNNLWLDMLHASKNFQVDSEITIVIEKEQLYGQLVLWLAALYTKNCPIVIHPDMPQERIHRLVELYRLGETCAVVNVPEGADFGVLTSGSTALPKILWRSLASWCDFFPIQNEIFKVDSNTRLFLHGSFSFTGTSNTVLSVLYEGGTIVTSQSMRSSNWISLCRQEQVTHLYMLPTKLRLLLAKIKEPLQHLKMIFAGSQLLDTKLMAMLKAKQPLTEIILYYGASELNYITWCTYEEWLTDPGTVGRAMPSVDIQIRDEVAINRTHNGYAIGNIFIHTPYGVEGLPMPYCVGDMGYINEQGLLHFIGRDGSIINCGGYKIVSSAVEAALENLVEVEEAVVLPMKEELRGEAPVAFITLTEEMKAMLPSDAYDQKIWKRDIEH